MTLGNKLVIGTVTLAFVLIGKGMAQDSHARGFDLGTVSIDGVRVGMTAQEAVRVWMSRDYNPPLCATRSSCNMETQDGSKSVYFLISLANQRIVSVTLFFPASVYPAMLRKMTRDLGKPNEHGSIEAANRATIWHSSDGCYKVGLADASDSNSEAVLSLEREGQ